MNLVSVVSTLAFLATFALLFLYVWRVRNAYLVSTYHRLTGRKFFELIRDQGAWFEYLVGRDVTRHFPEARVLYNLYVPKARGGTSECDVVALIEGRLVVFECKCYSGWVFGKQNETFWVETFNSRSKNRFYNPIRQNAGHIRALSTFLDIEPSSLVSVVVFSNHTDLRHVKTDGSVPVIKRRQLRKAVRKALDETCTSLFDKTAFDALAPLASQDEDAKRRHVDSIRRRFGTKGGT